MERYISRLIDEIISINNLHEKLLRTILDIIQQEDIMDLQSYIKYSLKRGKTLSYLANCYDLIVKDTMQEQLYFMRNKKYRYSSFNEVASSVYFNVDYMEKYMIGLALTFFFWPNHIKIRNYFLKHLPSSNDGMYLEIGPGHGFFMMLALRNTFYDCFLGVDISPTSVDLTNDILDSGDFGNFSKYEIIQADILRWDSSHVADCIVMGEVLEHVENPQALLKKIMEIANYDAHIFVSTCVNAPAIDHIYHYRSVDEIIEQIHGAGMYIKHRLDIPYFGKSLTESQSEKLPINVAMILGIES